MGSATALNQLFRNLCHHSMWKYAILWKFRDENHMLLTCEDSYAIDKKLDIAMEHAQYKEFISYHPWIASFGTEAIGQNGSIPACSILVAVFNMTRFSYLLGEGIVGKVASMERHQWICVGEMNSELHLEYPEELGLQVAAGIKTILLLPVLPLGLVQLGSMDKRNQQDQYQGLLSNAANGRFVGQTLQSLYIFQIGHTKLIPSSSHLTTSKNGTGPMKDFMNGQSPCHGMDNDHQDGSTWQTLT